MKTSEAASTWNSRAAQQAHVAYLQFPEPVVTRIHGNRLDFETPDTAQLYASLEDRINSLLGEEHNWIASAADIASIIYHDGLPRLNWAGFYFMEGQELVLGPFQGRPACVRLPLDEGVCGKAASSGRLVNIRDVRDFPGHIDCDPKSRSELAVPLVEAGRVVGVLDLDSPRIGRFTAEDEEGCVALAAFLTTRLRTYGNVFQIRRGIDESNNPGYTLEGRADRQTAADLPPGIMPDAKHDLNKLADSLGLTFEEAAARLTAATPGRKVSKNDPLSRARRIVRSYQRQRAKNPDYQPSREVLDAFSIINKDNYRRSQERKKTKLAM